MYWLLLIEICFICVTNLITYIHYLISYILSEYFQIGGITVEIGFSRYGVRALIFFILSVGLFKLIRYLSEEGEKTIEEKTTKIVEVKQKVFNEGFLNKRSFEVYSYTYKVEGGGFKKGFVKCDETTVYVEETDEPRLVEHIEKFVPSAAWYLTFKLKSKKSTNELYIPKEWLF